MTVKEIKNNNFWHGLFMGLIPSLVFSTLSVVQRNFWPIEKTDHSLIAVTFAFIMVFGFVSPRAFCAYSDNKMDPIRPPINQTATLNEIHSRQHTDIKEKMVPPHGLEPRTY